MAGAFALLFLSGSSNADAQGLGGLLNKAKQSVAPQVGTTLVLANGAEVINPIVDAVEVVPVGLYGISKSENFGEAYLVLQVTAKLNVPNVLVGCVRNDKMVALGGSGTLYNIDASGGFRYDVVEGMPVTVKLDEQGLHFLNVKKSDAVMTQVKVGVMLDNEHWGVVTFKNLPILWDQSPE